MSTGFDIVVGITNYNLPRQSDTIYNKLITDGFHPNQIILADNGSDKAPLAKNTNFQIPNNIRCPGICCELANYVLEKIPAKYYLYFGTSAKLLDYINYHQAFKEIIENIEKTNIGIVAPALINDEMIGLDHQNYTLLPNQPQKIKNFQPIGLLLSHEFLVDCRNNSVAFFSREFRKTRGWGSEVELAFFALKNNYKIIVDKRFSIEWRKNFLHFKNLADESTKNYRENAEKEMSAYFSLKYGANWRQELFYATGFLGFAPQPRLPILLRSLYAYLKKGGWHR